MGSFVGSAWSSIINFLDPGVAVSGTLQGLGVDPPGSVYVAPGESTGAVITGSQPLEDGAVGAVISLAGNSLSSAFSGAQPYVIGGGILLALLLLLLLTKAVEDAI